MSRALLLLMASLLAACAAKPARDRARAAAEQIDSLVAEARLLRREQEHGAIPETFRVIHRRMIADRLEQASFELRDAVEQGASARADAIEQALALRAELRR
jgi:hypothetical protein